MSLSIALRGKYGRTKIRVEKHIPDVILAATVIAGLDNATVAQHLALKDGALETYPKIMEAVRAFGRASRGWNVSSEGGLVDIDARTKGKGRGKAKGMRKERVPKSESKDATDNPSDKEYLYCKSKGTHRKALQEENQR